MVEFIDGIFAILEIKEWLFDEDRLFNQVLLNIYSNVCCQYLRIEGYFIRIEPLAIKRFALFSKGDVNVLPVIYSIRLASHQRKIGRNRHIIWRQLIARSILKEPNTFYNALGFFLR